MCSCRFLTGISLKSFGKVYGEHFPLVQIVDIALDQLLWVNENFFMTPLLYDFIPTDTLNAENPLFKKRRTEIYVTCIHFI